MILSIQYLRAIAVMLVVFSHTIWKNIQTDGSTLHWWHHAGTFGVDIFFIISGFIMVFITQKIHQEPKTVQTFLKKRFIRIVPLYWFYSIIALTIFLLIPEKINSGGGETEILKSFFLLPLNIDEKYLVGVGWTLHYEFLFYILFSFGLFFIRVWGNILVALLLILSITSSFFLPNEGVNYLFYNFLNVIFIEFLLGIFLYHILEKIPRIHWLISLFLLSLSLWLFISIFNDKSFTGIHRIDAGLTAFIISFSIISLESIWKKREVKFLSKIGDASYSTYLLHPFVLAAIAILSNKFSGFLPKNEYFLIILMFTTSIFVGYLAHLWIEKPLIRGVKKILY